MSLFQLVDEFRTCCRTATRCGRDRPSRAMLHLVVAARSLERALQGVPLPGARDALDLHQHRRMHPASESRLCRNIFVRLAIKLHESSTAAAGPAKSWLATLLMPCPGNASARDGRHLRARRGRPAGFGSDHRRPACRGLKLAMGLLLQGPCRPASASAPRWDAPVREPARLATASSGNAVGTKIAARDLNALPPAHRS
jgi:hypothetical protein